MIELLTDAMNEIRRLRHDNEILRAKVDTMELFAATLHTQPARANYGEAIDVAWKLEREIERLQADEAEEKVLIQKAEQEGGP